jgi:hypothetical protein
MSKRQRSEMPVDKLLVASLQCNMEQPAEHKDAGRSFGVTPDGTLFPCSRHYDADIDGQLGRNGKPPMKVIVSRAASENIRRQLKVPSVRGIRQNINDSVNLVDFLEYGSKTASARRAGNEMHADLHRTYDVRKWY